MRIVLITEFFEHPVPERHAEIVECLSGNITNPDIEEILLLVENKWTLPVTAMGSSKIKPVRISRRTTFGEAFEIINSIYREDTIYILANLDIRFNDTIGKLRWIDWNNRFVCLTRWNLKGYCGTHNGEPLRKDSIQWNHEDSHDCWITAQPIKHKLIENASFYMGIPGCDGKLCYLMQRCGYAVSNPCEDIQSFHVHLTGGEQGHRTYVESSRLSRPYGRVPKTRLHSIVKRGSHEAI